MSGGAEWSVADSRERYLAVATYLSSRAFPSRLLRLPDEKEEDDGTLRVLLPGVDMLNRE